jgi:hypothetical protein
MSMMNVNLYNQNTMVTVPTIMSDVETLPRVLFETLRVGAYFLRVNKGRSEIFMKFGKRTSLLILDSKGESGEVLKFKDTNKVIPLDSRLELQISSLTLAGEDEMIRSRDALIRMKALRPPVVRAQFPSILAPASEDMIRARRAVETLGETGNLRGLEPDGAMLRREPRGSVGAASAPYVGNGGNGGGNGGGPRYEIGSDEARTAAGFPSHSAAAAAAVEGSGQPSPQHSDNLNG